MKTCGTARRATGFEIGGGGAALGVAVLAAVGTGEYPSVVDACDHIIKMRDEVYQPDEEMAFIYDKVYQEFDALYPKLKENWKSILDLDFRY